MSPCLRLLTCLCLQVCSINADILQQFRVSDSLGDIYLLQLEGSPRAARQTLSWILYYPNGVFARFLNKASTSGGNYGALLGEELDGSYTRFEIHHHTIFFRNNQPKSYFLYSPY